VHDQLYIPLGDADDEEVLLRRRALETNYRYRTNVGVRYTFGSVFQQRRKSAPGWLIGERKRLRRGISPELSRPQPDRSRR
jgi:hypothetical protein